MNTTRKYFGRQDYDLHGGPVTWPGTADGFPIQGTFHGHLKQEEYENLENAWTFDCETFLTWDPDSMARFKKVMDVVANGLFVVRKRLEEYDPAHGGWRLYVEWCQGYGLPPTAPDAAAAHAESPAGFTYHPNGGQAR